MKKIMPILLCLTIMISTSACKKSDLSKNEATQTEHTVSLKLESKDYPLEITTTPIYDNVNFIQISASGEPTSYEELQDYIKCYKEVNFVKYKILHQYTPNEAVEITQNSIFQNTSTLYKVLITYDYLNQKDVNIEANVSKAGTATNQIENDPMYLIGQTYASFLLYVDNSRYTSLSPLTFGVYEINGKEFAFHIKFDNINILNESYDNLNLEVLDNEKSIVTSTKNNPVKFTQKSLADELGSYIREDWSFRGYVFEDLTETFTYNDSSYINEELIFSQENIKEGEE